MMIYDWRKNGRGIFSEDSCSNRCLAIGDGVWGEPDWAAAAGLIGAFVLCSVTRLSGGTLTNQWTDRPDDRDFFPRDRRYPGTEWIQEEGLSTIFMIFFLAGAIQVLLGRLR